jgi:hypothetical protein
MVARGSRCLQPSCRTGITLERTGLGACRAARGNGAIRRFSGAKGITSGAAATGPGKATSTSACAI